MDLKPSAASSETAGTGRGPNTIEVDSAYIHIPFCVRRCGYCNFTVIAGRDDLAPAVTRAIVHEIEGWPEAAAVTLAPRGLRTVFFGGGTPSRLPPKHLGEILDAIRRVANVDPAAEITLEVNPEDVTAESVRRWIELGFTRFSLGVQSFRAEKLRFLDRGHTAADATKAVTMLSAAGGNVSVDLIFAAGNETLAQWRDDLSVATRLPVVHLSTYGLTIEKGSAFYGKLHRDDLPTVSHDVEADMFDATLEDLDAAGFEHYEISNHARPGHRCRHNIRYWTGRPWLAAGPGAASFLPPQREVRHRSVTRYLAKHRERGSLIAESETLSSQTMCDEAIAFGLRMLDGVAIDELAKRRSVDARPYTRICKMFVDEGLLERVSDRELGLAQSKQKEFFPATYRLSPRGIRLADVVSDRFLHLGAD